MRQIILLTLMMSLHFDGVTQWMNVYPLSYDLKDVAVAEPSYVFLLADESNLNVILKSSDGARTWQKSYVGDEELGAIFFSDSLTGYVASYRAVYITVDGCRTWKKNQLPETFSKPQKIFFTSATTGYISFTSNKMIKTTDGGNTWKILDNAPLVTSFSFSDSNHGYAFSEFTIYKTTDGGTTWATYNFNERVQAIFAVDKNVAYLGTSFNTFRTLDGGITWQHVSRWSTPSLIHFTSVEKGLFFSDYSKIDKTIDGGKNLTRTYDSEFTFSWFRVSFSGNFGCALGSDFSILTTTDGGNHWTLNNIRPQHGNFRDVHFTTEKDGFIIGDGRRFIRTDDNGKSWYYDEHMERDDFYQIAFADPDTGIFIVTNNYAYHTNDGGKTIFADEWTVPIIGHEQSNDYEMIDSKTIYTVGAKTKVAKTIDGGKTWQSFEFEFSNSLQVIKCLDENTCHAVGIVGQIVSTWDGGKHWKVHNLLLNNDLKALHLLNTSVAFAGGSQGTIVRTTDGGNTWTIIPTEAQWSIISFHFISNDEGYAVTQGGEILRTDDQGVNWELWQTTDIPNGSYHSFNTSFMRDTLHIYGISDYGIFRCRPQKPVITAIEDRGKERKLSVYPNPTLGTLYFNEVVDEVTITNIHGVLKKHVKGKFSEMNIYELRSGLYIVSLTKNSIVHIHKIIKK